VRMPPQDKSFQVFSNELLEDRRANEWQTCHDGFACSRSQLRIYWMDNSRHFLK